MVACRRAQPCRSVLCRAAYLPVPGNRRDINAGRSRCAALSQTGGARRHRWQVLLTSAISHCLAADRIMGKDKKDPVFHYQSTRQSRLVGGRTRRCRPYIHPSAASMAVSVSKQRILAVARCGFRYACCYPCFPSVSGRYVECKRPAEMRTGPLHPTQTSRNAKSLSGVVIGSYLT